MEPTRKIRMLQYHHSGAAGVLEAGRVYDIRASVAEQIVHDFPHKAEFVDDDEAAPEDKMIRKAPRRKRRASGTT